MDKTIKVSVIVPVYQVEKYIARCIKSILNQTFTYFELILVDDGTKDNSIQIAEDILKTSNIHYVILSKQNGGLSSARNYGLKRARGKYVVFVDSDDELEEFFLKSLFDACTRFSSSIAIGQYTKIYNENNTVVVKKQIIKQPLIECIDNAKLCNLFFQREVEAHPCTVMYERKFLIDNNLLFNENVLFSEDQEFYWRAFPLVNKAALLNVKIYRYFVNMGSITTDPKMTKILSGFENLCVVSCNGRQFGISSNEIELRWALGSLHGTAKYCSLRFYLRLYKSLKYKSLYKKHKKKFRFKIEIALFSCYAFPILSYFLFKI